MTRKTPIVVLTAAILLLLASAVLTASWAQSAKTQLTDPDLARRFNKVSERLVCQCGCSEQLSVCSMQNCGSATPMRQEIERELVAGKSDDEIVQHFVDEEGLKVLSAPPAEGVNLAAWVMPGFALLVGLLFVSYMAARWAAKRRLAAATGSTAAVDPEIRKRIEEELKNRSQ